MGKYLFAVLLLACSFVLHAQVNLVPNPSFEDTLGCPQGVPDLDGKCKDWLSFRGTPDYYNSCSQFIGFSNPFGNQDARTGNAYAGFLTYQINILNATEHLAVQLSSPLQIGVKYYLSFYVSPAFNYQYTNIATNKMGAILTTTPYFDPFAYDTLPDSAFVKTDSIVTDTTSWFRISGSFIADSAYQYLVIGNFYSEGKYDTLQFPFMFIPVAAYYYVDDVCLSLDSLTCIGNVNLQQHNRNNSSCYYNGSLIIVENIDYDHYYLYDAMGKLVAENNLNSNATQIKVNILPGIYFITFYKKEKVMYQNKILIY